MRSKVQKVVVQVSGGIESTVALALAIKDYGKENVFPIAFDTDSIFWKHRDSIAVKRVITNLQLQQNLFICRMPQMDMLEYNRNEEYADVGFLPGMKMLFNTASMAYAQRVGAELVYIGNNKDNVFSDENPCLIRQNVDLYNAIYAKETNHTVSIEAPFSNMTKGEVIQLGVALGANIFDTVSCGREELSGGFNCGICPWCEKRRDGFAKAGIEDRTVYMLLPETYHFAHDMLLPPEPDRQRSIYFKEQT